MPLAKGSTPEVITQNIAELIRSGREPDQAAAIAYKFAQGKDAAAGILYRAGDSVLLCLRSGGCADYPLHWAFPGGKIEEGETSEQAALRESQEEIGYAPTDPLFFMDYGDGYTTYVSNAAEPFSPELNNEHAGYMWAPLNALPSPLHPGVANVLASLPVRGIGMDERKYDTNGWYEVKANPISKAGIFPYSGRQLGLEGPDADRIFNVLRPPEELADPECVESFKLLPWIDDHVMLGPVAQEMTQAAMPAEKKGVQGVIGENVFYKDGTLFANIKVFSSTLAALIEAGKRELSAGYRCIYEITGGVWNGLRYDAVQRKIRGNHLALVREGRMGPDVAVMDHFTFTFDAKDIEMDENKSDGVGSSMTLEQLVNVVSELAPQVAKLTAAMGTMLGAAESTEKQATGEIETPAADKEQAKEEAPVESPAAAMDEAAFIKRIAQRDNLARQISAHVGTFDHAEMTLGEVVRYGCDKLGVKAEAGQEHAALSGYLQAKPANVPAATVSGMDEGLSPKSGNFVTKHLGGK